MGSSSNEWVRGFIMGNADLFKPEVLFFQCTLCGSREHSLICHDWIVGFTRGTLKIGPCETAVEFISLLVVSVVVITGQSGCIGRLCQCKKLHNSDTVKLTCLLVKHDTCVLKNCYM